MDSIETSIFRNLFESICSEMGEILRLSSQSPNIKERLDYSCALFNNNSESFAFGSHIPVHLGAMPLSVKAITGTCEFNPEDTFILNDPFSGGTHLPDITLITPLFINGSVQFFVANRAHHSDVGGMKAGSMPLASEIYQEGLIIPPVRIIEKGKLNKDLLSIILANVRTPSERNGDLMAQIAANRRGKERLEELIKKYGFENILRLSDSLIKYTETLFMNFLKSIPKGIYISEDFLDNDGFSETRVRIRLKISIETEKITFDFTGSDPQTYGGINANRAIVYSAVLYVLNTLLKEDIPINSGVMRHVKLILPSRSVVNPVRPAAIAGGNVETSQRITDVILMAMDSALKGVIPAASQGTMNNISFGEGDSAYYETIGGGTGASSYGDGISAVHSHMTNSLNTPIEILERNFPVLMGTYSIRKASGGKGRHDGGDGIIREYKFLKDMTASLLTERRKFPPWGIGGGENGKCGRNTLIRGGKKIILSSKVNIDLRKGDILRIETPGGGGYGKKE